jgi:hypothetical protein
MAIMKTTLALLVPLLLLPAAARADVPTEHSVLLSGDFAVSFQHISSSESNSSSIDLLRLAPTFDWVAVKSLTIGAWLVWEHLSEGNTSADDYGIIPRVGWMAELGPNVFIWPRLGIGYLHGLPDVVNLAISTSAGSVNRVQLDIDVPIVFEPVAHFFVGVGPLLRVDLSSSASSGSFSGDASKLTAFGVTTMVGGYF